MSLSQLSDQICLNFFNIIEPTQTCLFSSLDITQEKIDASGAQQIIILN